MTASDARRAEARGNAFFTKHLEETDPEVWDAIENEFDRQQNEIELIASENIVSQSVLEAAGTLLTNKYAEGYPGVITAAANMSTWSSSSPSTALSACSTAPSSTSSRIPARRPISR